MPARRPARLLAVDMEGQRPIEDATLVAGA
jgi:hypothetical protein